MGCWSCQSVCRSVIRDAVLPDPQHEQMDGDLDETISFHYTGSQLGSQSELSCQDVDCCPGSDDGSRH